MRFIAVIIIWIVIIGGLSFYINLRDSQQVPTVQAKALETVTDAHFRVEITPTFGVEADPFALAGDSGSDAALVVRLSGVDINTTDTPLERGETLIIDDVQGFVVGNNELFLDASPPLTESSMSHALRIKVFRSNNLELEETIWGEAGSRVTGTLHINLGHDIEADHGH